MNLANRLLLSNQSHHIPVLKIDYDALLERGFLLVDVRTPEEYKEGHVDGAINIPLKKLKQSLNAFKVNIRPVLFYCKSGKRSQKAFVKALSKGIDCYNGGTLGDVKQALTRHQYVFVSRPKFMSIES